MKSLLGVSLALVASASLLATACKGELIDAAPPGQGGAGGAGGGGGAGGEGPLYPLLACDPLVPSYCGFPFPSNVYSEADVTAVTGRRVVFLGEGLPQGDSGHVQDPTPWARADGFSPGSPILAHFPGAVGDGLPGVLELERSLEDDSPTVVLDAETGERVLHWSELDRSGTVEEERALLIHPAVPLRDGARYIVAVRGLVDADGEPIAPTDTFKALRDDEASEEASIEERRRLYDDIFALLEDASVPRSELLLAWDFTTASRESNTDWLVHMRDEAFELVGEDGPAYTITTDTTLDPANIQLRVTGTMTVPLYLDQPEPGASLLFGEDGLPEPNPDTPTYEVEFELIIPNSATAANPAKLLQYGHGLLGSHTQVESEHFRTFCNTFNYALFSTKWVGLAEEDEDWIATQLANGEVDNLSKMFDRVHQGMINNLLVMRLMSTGLDVDPDVGPLIDGSQRYYWGISQGGISGGVYMALSTDVSRGTLEVPGQPYNVLLNRSVDFTPFFILFGLEFPDARQQQHLLGLIQMLWDRVEPQAYTKYMFEDTFPGSPADRRLLVRAAIGDHQVTTFGAHIMARAMNAKHLDTGLREIHGLPMEAGPIDENGAVYAEWDFGLPPEPTCNVPLDTCEDPHGKLRKLDSARAQIDEFFRTGVVANTCAAGVCAEPTMSGCVGGEDQNLCD